MKLADYIFGFLEEQEVEAMFYVPGGGCMHLLDALARSKKIKGISLLHEQGVAIATESYSFSKGKIGVALVTTGPGGTNTVTGVLSAYLDSIPCIFLSGQVKTSDLKSSYGVRSHGSQEADMVSIMKHITKYAAMVTDKNKIRYHMEKALYEATHGRKGPVWLDIPLDIQGSDIEVDELIGFYGPVEAEGSYTKEARQIIDLLKEAKRPVIIAGNGVREREEEFKRLIEKLGVPVIPTWKAADIIPNGHPLYIGRCGTLGERAANFAMQKADLLISFGSRLDFSITGFDRSGWAVNSKKVIIDLDGAELYKLQTKIDLPIAGDAGKVIEALNKEVEGQDPPAYDKWLLKIAEWKETYSIWKEKRVSNANLISTYDFMKELCKQLTEDAVLVPASAGTVAEIFYQALTVKKGQMVRSNHGLGAMGYELPAAIGAQIATGKVVISVCGDGGMQLNIQELAVIAGRRLPIKIFVINNQGYSSIRNMQRNHFQGRYFGSNQESGLYLPDMKALANAYGIPAVQIEKPEQLPKGIAEALETDGPFLCDILIDPDCIVSPRASSKVLPNGQIESTGLENLFPFLPMEELEKELMVQLD